VDSNSETFNVGDPAIRGSGSPLVDWLKANKPEVLDSKVEKTFREKGWKIIRTPTYSPK
jgi:methionine synthase I (cobalamin-dependent)